MKNSTGMIALFFIIIALIFTIPILNNIQISGRDDSAAFFYWATWYPIKAFTGNYDIVSNTFLLFPAETNLFPAFSLTTSLFYFILRSFLGPVLAYNILTPIFAALNAFLGYLFLRRHTTQNWIAVSGGFLIAFNPITHEYAQNGEVALMGFFVVLMWLILWERFIQTPSFQRMIPMILGLYVIVVTSIQYWSILITLLLPYVVYTLWQSKNRSQYIDSFLLGGLIFAGCLYIYPASILIWSSYIGIYQPFEVWYGLEAPLLVPLVVYVILLLWTSTRPIPSLLRRLGLGWVGLNLIGVLLPQWSPLSLISTIFAVPNVPLLTHRPLFAFTLIVVGVLLLGRSIRSPLPRIVWFLMPPMLLLLSGWWLPLSTVSVPNSSQFAAMANDPEDYVVAYFPNGADSLERRAITSNIDLAQAIYPGNLDHDDLQEIIDSYPRFGFYDTAGQIMLSVPQHKKRSIGGIVSTLRPDQIAMYNQMPLMRLLSVQSIDNPMETARTLREDIRRWRVGYLMIDHQIADIKTIQGFRDWLIWTNTFCYLSTDKNLEFWRAQWHPAGCNPSQVDIGTIERGLEYGWYAVEDWNTQLVRWSQKESRISSWVTPSHDYRLTIRIASPGIESQEVHVFANDTLIGNTTLVSDWQQYSFIIPRSLIQSQFLEITLEHREIVMIEGRELSAAYDWFMLEKIIDES